MVAGAGAGALDPLGAALALGAALVYSAYILVSDGLAGAVRPLLLAALVCTGAAVSLDAWVGGCSASCARALSAAGWGWLACLAVVSTVARDRPVLRRAGARGPTTASILATVEPVVTVVLAFLAFGETLGPSQLAGGGWSSPRSSCSRCHGPRRAAHACPPPRRPAGLIAICCRGQSPRGRAVPWRRTSRPSL